MFQIESNERLSAATTCVWFSRALSLYSLCRWQVQPARPPCSRPRPPPRTWRHGGHATLVALLALRIGVLYIYSTHSVWNWRSLKDNNFRTMSWIKINLGTNYYLKFKFLCKGLHINYKPIIVCCSFISRSSQTIYKSSMFKYSAQDLT